MHFLHSSQVQIIFSFKWNTFYLQSPFTLIVSLHFKMLPKNTTLPAAIQVYQKINKSIFEYIFRWKRTDIKRFLSLPPVRWNGNKLPAGIPNSFAIISSWFFWRNGLRILGRPLIPCSNQSGSIINNWQNNINIGSPEIANGHRVKPVAAHKLHVF